MPLKKLIGKISGTFPESKNIFKYLKLFDKVKYTDHPFNIFHK